MSKHVCHMSGKFPKMSFIAQDPRSVLRFRDAGLRNLKSFRLEVAK